MLIINPGKVQANQLALISSPLLVPVCLFQLLLLHQQHHRRCSEVLGKGKAEEETRWHTPLEGIFLSSLTPISITSSWPFLARPRGLTELGFYLSPLAKSGCFSRDPQKRGHCRIHSLSTLELTPPVSPEDKRSGVSAGVSPEHGPVCLPEGRGDICSGPSVNPQSGALVRGFPTAQQ